VPIGFQDFDIDGFLRDNWQKRPALIRNPWTDWSNPLDPDELAGLACESGVESRLITQSADAIELELGPLPEGRFGQLGRKPWTLLVQAVDHYVPAVAALIEPFRFVPNWRIDDVMVSYAVDGGGVGAHFDHYDVFLIQGLGRRRWQVGGPCDAATELLPHDELRLLAHFEPTDEWILEPGDILYVPPGVSHNGIAVGDDCMTYSIGFRAPSRRELLGSWTESLLDKLEDDDRYADPDLRKQANVGEIALEAIDRLHALVTQPLRDRDAFAQWFGQYTTAPKYPEVDWSPDQPVSEEAVRSLLAQDVALLRNPASRFSYVRRSSDDVALFVNGAPFDCAGGAASFARRLCAHNRIVAEPADSRSPTIELILELLNRGSLAFDTEH